MAGVAFKVQLDDDQWHEVREPKLSDLVAFERQFGVPASSLEPEPKLNEVTGEPVLDEKGEPVLQITAKLEWICFLLWRGLRKAGVIAKDVPFDDDFLDRVEDVEVPGAEKEQSEEVSAVVPPPYQGAPTA